MMPKMRKLVSALGAGVALVAVSGAASADGYEAYAPPPPPAEEGRKFSMSFGLTGTSDYVFRGVSQTLNDPTIQGSIDAEYGMFYAGAWASGLDFGGTVAPGDGFDAQVEIDYYAGIKPTWNSPFGKMDLDFGVIYYTYPGANDFQAEYDYIEFKAGYSWSVWHPNLTTGTVLYYSPDYFGETGGVWTFESTAAWKIGDFHGITPSITGVWGTQYGDNSEGYSVNGSLEDHYQYWNAGLEVGIENITLDFRYWDTDIGFANGGSVCGATNLCDTRFVFSASISVP